MIYVKRPQLNVYQQKRVLTRNGAIIMMSQQQMVAEFHQAFNHPMAEKPQMVTGPRAKARLSWIEEEVQEFRDSKNITEQADAMVDLMYFTLGMFVEMGIDAEPLFEIVHNANMQKLWPDGKPRFRENDGKVVKPPTWTDPMEKLKAEVKRQIQQADPEDKKAIAG